MSVVIQMVRPRRSRRTFMAVIMLPSVRVAATSYCLLTMIGTRRYDHTSGTFRTRDLPDIMGKLDWAMRWLADNRRRA